MDISRLAEEALGKGRFDLACAAGVTSLGALTASIAHRANQPLPGIVTNAGTCLGATVSKNAFAFPEYSRHEATVSGVAQDRVKGYGQNSARRS